MRGAKLEVTTWIVLGIGLAVCGGCGDDSGAGGDDGGTSGSMDSGTGGDDAGSGGADDAGNGGADDAGGGGGGGGQVCQEECSGDEDCTVDGNDIGATCQDSRCRTDAGSCESDAECVALFNGWTLGDSDGDFMPDAPCTAPTPTPPDMCPEGEVCCNPGQVCLESGYCATPPSDAVSCETFMAEETTATDIEGNETTVCAQPGTGDAVCEDGACRNPCGSDADCADPVPSCNGDTGRCECVTDPEDSCAGNERGGTVCQDNGACGCGDVSECAGSPAFDGTEYVCAG